MLTVLALTFLVTVLAGVPIAFSLGLAAAATLVAWGQVPLWLLAQRMFTGVDSFVFMAIPFFILAGELMTTAGILDRLVKFADALVGHICGGLAHVAIVAECFFSGISGSAVADAAALSAVLSPSMAKQYGPDFGNGVVASAAMLGPIIPPSIPMVVYALAAGGVSIAGLFIAGIIPGIVLAAGMMAIAYVIARRRGFPVRARTMTWREFLPEMWTVLPALLMPVIILGGILGGIFTATEASAVGVFYALFIGFFVTKKLTLRTLPKVVVQSALVSSAALVIVSMASLFANILTLIQLPQIVAAYITSLSRDPTVIMTLVAIFVLICGLFIDTLPAVIILVPVLAPVADQVGIDPLHFAMAFVLNITIGMVTPPVGAVLFIITAVGQLNFAKLSRAIVPMVLALLVVLLMVMYIPAISLTLPRWFGFAR